MSKVVIAGAGSQGKVVLDMALQDESIEVWGLADDDPARLDQEMLGVPVRCSVKDLLAAGAEDRQVIVAFGSNDQRAEVIPAFQEAGWPLYTALHASAVISPHASIGAGCMISPNAVINASAVIGDSVIINTGAQVDHDCVVGDFAQIAPGAVLCGHVQVGERGNVGAGATVLQGITIGAGAFVGAGAVVTKNVEPGVTVVGVPAERMR